MNVIWRKIEQAEPTEVLAAAVMSFIAVLVAVSFMVSVVLDARADTACREAGGSMGWKGCQMPAEGGERR